VREMQVAIPKEWDFSREARLMATLRERIARVSKAIVVPEPVMPLCTPGMIVMSRLQGQPLTSLLAEANRGNEVARKTAYACLLPIFEVYGHMILVDGLMHADPHPGNIISLAGGKVGLVDFGNCKALTSAERRGLCALYLALAAGDASGAVKAVEPLGLTFGAKDQQPGGAVDLAAAMKLLLVMFDTRYVAEGSSYAFDGGNVVAGAPLTSFPGQLWSVCRSILILRGLCHSLKFDLSITAAWKKYAVAGLKEGLPQSETRAAANAQLDRGLEIKGMVV